MYSSLDSVAVATGAAVGMAGGAAPGPALWHAIALQAFIKLLEKAPDIIRAIKTRRAARKAVTKNDN